MNSDNPDVVEARRLVDGAIHRRPGAYNAIHHWVDGHGIVRLLSHIERLEKGIEALKHDMERLSDIAKEEASSLSTKAAEAEMMRESTDMEIAWLRREIQWCRTRLKKDVYRATLDKHLAEGPRPLPENEPDVILSGAALALPTTGTAIDDTDMGEFTVPERGGKIIREGGND